MSEESKDFKKPLLNRSPLLLKLEDGVEKITLSSEAQKQLGCFVNQDLFLECPYAFASRTELLRLARKEDSNLAHLATDLDTCNSEYLLLGYTGERIIPDDPADFVLYISEESSRLAIQHNRQITHRLLNLARQQVSKLAGDWQELGSAAELESALLGSGRTAHELELRLPVGVLCRSRQLGDRGPDEARDGYVELTSDEDYCGIKIGRLAKVCQTQLESVHVAVQTYPGNPKNQWTQYELELSEEFVSIWTEEKVEEKVESEEASGTERSTDEKEEKEISEEELQFQEKKRNEWQKLADFLKSKVDEIIDAISFNASTNFYVNDVAEVKRNCDTLMLVESRKNYKEKVSLIDLKTIGDMCLMSASWHQELNHVIVGAYLDKDAKEESLIAIWSLLSPLRPSVILNCEQQVSAISFCPRKSYTNIIIGGCLDGKIIVWEIFEKWFTDDKNVLDNQNQINDKPDRKDATIAESGDESQKISVISIQWLPSWCRLGPGGSLERITIDLAKDPGPQFATASTDNSIFFWALPRSLSGPAQARSPLHLSLSSIYQLVIEDNSTEDIPLCITSFCFPLAETDKEEDDGVESHSLEPTKLDRLQRVFLGTSSGEVLCCIWSGQADELAAGLTTGAREICNIGSRRRVHDGPVRTLIQSAYLDGVMLSVGGRVFGLWTRELGAEAPLFRRRCSESRYAAGCWSERTGAFVLARMDGWIEYWDLSRRPNQPVIQQAVCNGPSVGIWASSGARNRPIALLQDTAVLRILAEPKATRPDEDLERLGWIEEYAWRETRRKLDFLRWQEDYLSRHPVALKRRAEREKAEAARRHQEAREKFMKEQEILARQKAERKLARRKLSKSAIWRQNELRRAEDIMLARKGFSPAELEEKRKPLVVLEEQRAIRSRRIAGEMGQADEILKSQLVREVPDMVRTGRDADIDKEKDETEETEFVEKTREELEEEYRNISEELKIRMKQKPYVPRFDWNEAFVAGYKRSAAKK